MRTVFDANSLPVIIALLIGVLVAWWMFKRRSGAGRNVEQTRDDRVEGTPAAQRVEQERTFTPVVDGREPNDIVSSGAAAMGDVAGDVLGVRVHEELPGAEGPPDNLALMKGVGPKLVTRLHENGISRFDQLARLGENEIFILDEKMGPFKGRLRRDRIVEQASYLARGDTDGFEAQFGKLGSTS